MSDAFIITNGTIATMNPAQPEVEAVGIIDDKIVAVGTRQMVEAALPRDIRTIDLAGSFAMPECR